MKNSVLDETVLEELKALGGDNGSDLLNDLLSLYLQNAPVSFEKIKVALRDGDSKTLKDETHRLKANSGSLGAMEFYKICNELETNARLANMNDAMKLRDVFEKSYADVIKAVSDLRRA